MFDSIRFLLGTGLLFGAVNAIPPCWSDTPTGQVWTSNRDICTNSPAPAGEAPQTTTSTAPVVTEAPVVTSFSAISTDIPGLTENAQTETTDKDGHTTIIPIWFIKPGFGLLNIPLGGVYPPGPPPPPVWPEIPPLPTLEVGPPGGKPKPKTEGDPDKPDEECTKVEAPQCTITIEVGPAKSPETGLTTSTKTTECSTITECSATAGTTTTTTTISAEWKTAAFSADSFPVQAPMGAQEQADVSNAILSWQATATGGGFGMVASSTPAPAPTVNCGDQVSEFFMDPGSAIQLAGTFCDGVDFSQDTKKTSDKTDKGDTIDFEYKTSPDQNNDACNDAYKQIITRCQYDSHTYNKQGSFGSYSLKPNTVTGEQPEEDPNGTGRTCQDPAPQGNKQYAFDRDEALNTVIPQFCDDQSVSTTLDPSVSTTYPSREFWGQVNLNTIAYLSLDWDPNCPKSGTTSYVDPDTCKRMLSGAVDNCNLETAHYKNGGSLTKSCVIYKFATGPTPHWQGPQCTALVTQYKPTKDKDWYSFDITLQDGGGANLAVSKDARATPNFAVIPGNNYGRLPTVFQASQREYDGQPISFNYQKQGWSSTDGQCTGGGDDWKDGKRDIKCTFDCP